MTGLQIGAKLQQELRRQIPVIILTGDISTGALQDISMQDCVKLNKPADLGELSRAIQALLQKPRSVQQIGRAHAELQSLMRISSAVFCLKKKKTNNKNT